MWCSLAGTIQTAAQWTTATHAWPFDWYCIILLYYTVPVKWSCIILLYSGRRIQHSINWYIIFQVTDSTDSVRRTWPLVHWTLGSSVRIRPRECMYM
jgi:hypothetical protein